MAKKHDNYKASMVNADCVYLQGWFRKKHEKLIKSYQVNKTKLANDDLAKSGSSESKAALQD